jgi:hypothetical protein
VAEHSLPREHGEEPALTVPRHHEVPDPRIAVYECEVFFEHRPMEVDN